MQEMMRVLLNECVYIRLFISGCLYQVGCADIYIADITMSSCTLHVAVL